MEFKIYNTMTQQKEVFTPIVPGKVGMYLCGITPYALSHLGHARAAVSFDLLYRYLEHLKYKVTYVRNFTDIDDKCRPPSEEPRVSQHIEQIKDMVTQSLWKNTPLLCQVSCLTGGASGMDSRQEAPLTNSLKDGIALYMRSDCGDLRQYFKKEQACIKDLRNLLAYRLRNVIRQFK
ncbi:hypothetical protein KPL70_006614 [Citrus sinensis]|nr:hypothetical protein KPL70_006614 [Citrus sinensis]